MKIEELPKIMIFLTVLSKWV